MKRVLLGLLLLAPLPLPVSAQSPPPPAANDAKPASSIAGKWAMTVDLENPNASSTLEIKLDGTKVSGSIVSANTFDITGEYVGGKLSFSMVYNAQTTVRFSGQLRDDGTLGGTMDYGEGAVNWRAKRP